MGGCCCCCAFERTEVNRSAPFLQHSVSEEREPLSSHHESVSAISNGLLVDTYLDTSVPDTYQPPPAPIPYDTYVETTRTESIEDPNTGSTLETKEKNLKSDENAEIEASKEVEDERSDDLKKSSKPPADPPLEDEDDICPICLEEYDTENPKILTKCDHHFHFACILEWMERSSTCAVCDQEMIISPDVGG